MKKRILCSLLAAIMIIGLFAGCGGNGGGEEVDRIGGGQNMQCIFLGGRSGRTAAAGGRNQKQCRQGKSKNTVFHVSPHKNGHINPY